MLVNSTHLKGLEIRATDGEIGSVDEFYFEDETWVIRYLVVQTGGWLGGRVDLAVLHPSCGLGSQAIGCGADENTG
jgi:hypothetical protein